MNRRIDPRRPRDSVIVFALVLMVAGCADGTAPPSKSSSAPPASTPASSKAMPTSPRVTSSSRSSPGTTPSAESRVTLVSVTDGDTIRVLVDGVEEKVRLIGINTPESGECLYSEATSALSDLLEGGAIRLEPDVSNRDDYGRLLRYVYVGDVFVNEVLVRQGLAIARRYEPDTSRAGRLEAAQNAAEADGVGMWNPDACGAEAAGTLQIDQVHYDAQGNDNDNLNDEWVEFTNPGPGSIDLTGWEIKDESASHRYRFPSDYSLTQGTSVRLYTGCGTDTATALYWCSQDSAVWNNSGDTVFVLDPSGNIVTEKSYSG